MKTSIDICVMAELDLNILDHKELNQKVEDQISDVGTLAEYLRDLVYSATGNINVVSSMGFDIDPHYIGKNDDGSFNSDHMIYITIETNDDDIALELLKDVEDKIEKKLKTFNKVKNVRFSEPEFI